MSWINDLDALASAGVIGFDAPAYIKGVQPRYYGHPALETLPDTLPQMNSQPKKDEFKTSGTGVNNPSWKKWVFGILATAGLIFGASKLKSVKNLFSKISITTIKTLPKKLFTSIKTGFNHVINLFKKPKP